MELYLYQIDVDYVEALHRLDSRVEYHHGEHDKPYVGIILKINNIDYFVPLSSPKRKHDRMNENPTFMKIKQNNGRLLAVLNLNNMIPVPKDHYSIINFEELSDQNYKNLLDEEYQIIKQRKSMILRNARLVHRFVVDEPESHARMLRYCCDFSILENFCIHYW